jgi:L-lactate utilization protein LutB
MESEFREIGKALAEQLPPLARHEAAVESDHCLVCYDAPCTHACPTHIDIPRFIKKIATGNLKGLAATIFASNLLGATCATGLSSAGVMRGRQRPGHQRLGICFRIAIQPSHEISPEC